MILAGIGRWAGALALAGFTLMARFLANRFWDMAPPERFMAANGFFEPLGLVGGCLLVAWEDVRRRLGQGPAAARETGRTAVDARAAHVMNGTPLRKHSQGQAPGGRVRHAPGVRP